MRRRIPVSETIDGGQPDLRTAYRHLAGYFPGGAVILHEGRVVLANEAFARRTGLALAAVEDQPLAGLAVSEDRERVARSCTEALSAAEGSVGFSMARTGGRMELTLIRIGQGLEAVLLGVAAGGRIRDIENGVGEMCHSLSTQLMHVANAKDGIVEELETLRSLAAETDLGRNTAWADIQSSLDTYCNGLDHAYRSITAAMRTFNALFASIAKGHPDI